MQLPIIGHRGQVKPYNSIPRINWAHPLTAGLVSYCYDVGCGPIDLVTGSQRIINNSSNPPFGGPVTTKYGRALSAVNTLTSVTNGLYYVPGNTDIDNLIVAAPYSYGCGVMMTANAVGFTQIFSTCNSAAVSPVQIGTSDSFGTDYWWKFVATGATQPTAAGAYRLNNFQSLLGVAISGSAARCYLDGILNLSPAITTTAAATSGSSPMFHALRSSAGQSIANGVVYYGAVWKNRALTASEARLLHDDPYCFLIYPEDEIFASLVGTRATQIRIPFGVSQDDGRTFTQMVGY